MKKNLISSAIFLLLVASMIITGQNKFLKSDSTIGGKKTSVSTTYSNDDNSSFYFKQQSKKSHSTQNLNCKTCHDCEYPTKEDPCLKYCPREGLITVHHSPDECPEVIPLDDISNRFGPVVFSHKIHAQMSEMSSGCQGCHHYNTTGPVLACKKCHEKNRQRENIDRTDLEGAYHRQCMNCHRQWSHTTDCNSCHIAKTSDYKLTMEEKIKQFVNKNHPLMIEPNKLVFTTNNPTDSVVTFFHQDHIQVFNLPCNTCHRDENCIKCHDLNNQLTHNIVKATNRIKVNKSFEDHHKACGACHVQDNCSKCHSDKELAPWSHDKSTRFALKHYHETLPCEKCHARKNQFAKLNIECSSCHSTWKQGNFNHAVTGIALSENHIELECDNCHTDRKFTQKPVCNTCHDDRQFPKNMPGKMVSVKGKKKM